MRTVPLPNAAIEILKIAYQHSLIFKIFTFVIFIYDFFSFYSFIKKKSKPFTQKKGVVYL